MSNNKNMRIIVSSSSLVSYISIKGGHSCDVCSPPTPPPTQGEANRIIGEHSLNQHSSRSHCIFTVHIESRSRTLSSPNYTISKLNLVDLAGSERLSKTNVSTRTIQTCTCRNKANLYSHYTITRNVNSNHKHVHVHVHTCACTCTCTLYIVYMYVQVVD